MATPLSRQFARMSGVLVGTGGVLFGVIGAVGGQVTYAGEARFLPIYVWWRRLGSALAGVVVRWRRVDAEGIGLWLALISSLMLSIWGFSM